MNRYDMISEYVRLDNQTAGTIESSAHAGIALEFLKRQIKIHTPSVVVKAGAGNSGLYLELLESIDILIIVEPDFATIKEHVHKFSDKVNFDKVRFINGDLENMPLDWYSSDMIICIDYLDFHNVASVLDEFKRIVDFEGELILAGSVLHDDDVEGVYDELFRLVLPLHNDFYMTSDLNTVLGLKKFRELESEKHLLKIDLQNYVKLGEIITSNAENGTNLKYSDYIEKKESDLKKYYDYENNNLYENYLVSVYKSEKPGKKEYEEEVAEYTRRMGRSQELL
jgi:ubiquinone/menaquinone biosynthesis C-methylase UbiE